jgi:hypothetical protein
MTMEAYDPAKHGFDQARLLMALSKISATVSKEVAEVAYGSHNPLFMESDATSQALQLFADLRATIDHYDTQARVARRSSAAAA